MSVKINRTPTDREWKLFTIFGSKKNYFSTETYFRESFFDGYEVIGDNFADLMVRTAVVVLKPEVFASGKARAVISLIEKYDFRLKAFSTVKYDRLKIRETWRYQYSEATIDRMSLVDHLYCLGDAMILFFEDTSSVIRMPASARLHKLNGASEARLRTADNLRSIIRIPNGVIRLFHIPDEPADIIREMGILFEREQRLSLYNQLRSDSRADNKLLNEAVTELESQHPLHDFSLDTAWNNIIASSNDEKFISEIENLKEQVEKQEIVGWDDVYSLLKKHNCSIYDILTVASYVLKQDVDYEFHLIDGDALRGWDPTFFAEH